MYVPAAPGEVFTEEAAQALVGQWTTVLLGGAAIMCQITDAGVRLNGNVVWLGLQAEDWAGLKIGQEGFPPPPATEDEELSPVFTYRDTDILSSSHVNCEHDPAGMDVENAMVCSGPLP